MEENSLSSLLLISDSQRVGVQLFLSDDHRVDRLQIVLLQSDVGACLKADVVSLVGR